MITVLVALTPYVLIFMAGAFFGSLVTAGFLALGAAAKRGDRQIGVQS